MLLILFALLCITSVFCAVSKSANYPKNEKNAANSTITEDLAKNDNNTIAKGLSEQKLGSIINSVIETSVNDFMSTFRSSEETDLKWESRKQKKEPDLMSRILPMLIIPFMLQTAIIPMMLTTLKFMLMKSAFIGKMAILLGLLNLFRRANNQGGVFTHNIFLEHQGMPEKLAEDHYGYNAGDEYGAYSNRRKRTIR